MIDQLQIYRGKDYEINPHICVRQPTLDEICDYGEQRYLSLVQTLCATPADMKVEIWDSLHIYWDQVDEYDLFLALVPRLQEEDVSILFPRLDIASMKRAVRGNIHEIVLVGENGVVIDRDIYTLFTSYIRQSHGLKKNKEVGYNDITKDFMIEDDRDEQYALQRKRFTSTLLPLISSMTNCEGFKYRWDDVWSLPIGVFMDAVQRVQVVKNYDNLMHGIYSGCVDTKKISKKELEWMRELQ